MWPTGSGRREKQPPNSLNSLGLEVTQNVFTYMSLASTCHLALSQLQSRLGSGELMDICRALADLRSKLFF